MQRKRNILLLLLLLVMVIILLLYFFKSPKTKPTVFILQGQTILQAGEVGMKIWDNNTEDGDTVAVYLNGKLIADSVAILYQPRILPLGKLTTGEHILGVKAINMGMVAPASASISLTDEKGTHEFVMDAWIDSAASWKIIVH